MENEATVEMPVTLTREMLRALQENDLTRIDDREERYLRIGWLVCAWDVLIEQRTGLPPNDKI